MQEASLFDLFLLLRGCSLIGYDCFQGVVRVGEAGGEGVVHVGGGVYDSVSSLLFCYFCRWALVVVMVRTDHRKRRAEYFAEVSVGLGPGGGH